MLRRTVQKDCLPFACPQASLFRAANAFRITWSERVFSQIRHRNALTEIAWEDAVQGLGGNVYRSVTEKQRIVTGIVVYRQHVLQTVTSVDVVSLILRRYELLKIANFNPQQEARFSLRKKLVPREWRKWSLGLGHN